MGMHTHYNKGTTIFIRLKSGKIIVGKFADHKSGKVILEDGSIVALSDVKAMSIRKLNSRII